MNPLTPDELEAELRDIGAERYHDKHPFHRRLHAGGCTKAQVQAWALNRYCYQATIPLKDAAILSRIPDASLRRAWRQRLVDHDGERDGEGGIVRWLKLTDALGLNGAYVMSMQGALPGTRFAVDAYLHFARDRTLLEAIASSLTELFSPQIIHERVSGMLANYDFITEDTLAYFTLRPHQARRDVDVALGFVKAHARTSETQALVLDSLRFKCDVLWSMLDSLEYAYVVPGCIPPGAWRPEDGPDSRS